MLPISLARHRPEGELGTPRLAATDVTGTLQIGEGRTVTIALSGFVNTGATTIEGTVNLADMAAPQGRLHLTGRNIALEYPPGLQNGSSTPPSSSPLPRRHRR